MYSPKYKYFFELDEITIAWCAGLFEGEGSIDAERQYITIKMTDYDIVQRIAKVWQVDVYEMPRNSKSIEKNYKIQYRAVLRGITAAYFLRRIMPYLGKRRASKANEFLSICEFQYRRVNLLFFAK